jgi:hypothetical protein
MKALEWSPINYLSRDMYDQWQSCLLDEKIRKDERNKRREYRRKQKELKLLNLQREFSASNRRKIPDQTYESPTFTGHRDVADMRNLPAFCIHPTDSNNSTLKEVRHLNRPNFKSSPIFTAEIGDVLNTTPSPKLSLIPRSQSQPLFPSTIDVVNNRLDFDPELSD